MLHWRTHRARTYSTRRKLHLARTESAAGRGVARTCLCTSRRIAKDIRELSSGAVDGLKGKKKEEKEKGGKKEKKEERERERH